MLLFALIILIAVGVGYAPKKYQLPAAILSGIVAVVFVWLFNVSA